MLEAIATVAGVALIALALFDAFETIVLPRRVMRVYRLASVVFLALWDVWVGFGRIIRQNTREGFLSFYGPMSLIFLVAVWAAMLVVGFGLIGWGLGSAIDNSGDQVGMWNSIYFSGSTFFTLGIGDVRPDSAFSRVLEVVEAGAGFGFLALIITYLPVLYQAFSRREVNVSLLDSRAGSPPTAGEAFRRFADVLEPQPWMDFLRDWERWSAELLETHLSYPILATYRSQHERQSWLAALTFILDVSSVVLAGGVPGAQRTARMTFAMARHAAVDLNQAVGLDPREDADRLPDADFEKLIAIGGPLLAGVDREKLAELRASYEPHVAALSESLLMALPPWLPEDGAEDAWQSSKWES